MHQNPQRYLSALLSLPPHHIVGSRDDAWRRTFPFSAPHGSWAFSGRVALAHGLPHIGLPPGSTILVPAYFQGTEIDTLLRAGYRLSFYRLTPLFEVDLDDVARRITDRTSALYIIHYFGLPQAVERIAAFCRERGLKLIEDCALALYSKAGDAWLGSFGDLALFSVYKTVPLPHGGYVVIKPDTKLPRLPRPPLQATVNQTLDLVMEHLHSGGARAPLERTRRAWRLLRRTIGWKRETAIESGSVVWDGRLLGYGSSRLVEWLMGLQRPDDVIARRRRNFTQLHATLRRFSVLRLDALPDGACPLFYPIVVEDKARAQQELKSRGIGTVNLWSDFHSACPKEFSREVEPWRRRILELPIHHLLGDRDIERIGRTVEDYLENRVGAEALDAAPLEAAPA